MYILTYILNVGNYKEKVQFSSKGKKKRKNDVINNELSGSRGANLYFFCRQFTVAICLLRCQHLELGGTDGTQPF